MSEPKTKKTRKSSGKGASKTSDNASHDINVIVTELMQIEDINSDPNGDSSKSQDKSARKQFLSFLGDQIASFEDIHVEILTKATLGRFCTYMVENDSIGYQTSINYLSSIRRQLEKCYDIDFFTQDPVWYKETRKLLHRTYVLNCLKGKLAQCLYN